MHAATIAGVFRTTDCWATFAAVGPLTHIEHYPELIARVCWVL